MKLMPYLGIKDGFTKSHTKNTIILNDINIQVKMSNKTIINKCRH